MEYSANSRWGRKLTKPVRYGTREWEGETVRCKSWARATREERLGVSQWERDKRFVHWIVSCLAAKQDRHVFPYARKHCNLANIDRPLALPPIWGLPLYVQETRHLPLVNRVHKCLLPILCCARCCYNLNKCGHLKVFRHADTGAGE